MSKHRLPFALPVLAAALWSGLPAAARADEPATAPSVGALTLEASPAARFLRVMTLPADTNECRDALGRLQPTRTQDAYDRALSDSFTRHAPGRAAADAAPARPRPVFNDDDAPARRRALAVAPAAPSDFSPLIVAPASAAGAPRVELVSSGGTSGAPARAWAEPDAAWTARSVPVVVTPAASFSAEPGAAWTTGSVPVVAPAARASWNAAPAASFLAVPTAAVPFPDAAALPARTGAGSGAFTDLLASAPVQIRPAPLLAIPQTNALPTGATLYAAETNGNLTTATGSGGTVATYKTIGSELFGIGYFGGSLFVVDQGNKVVDRIVLATGVVSQFASLGSTNTGATALAIDPSGNVYVALTNNSTVDKITPGGVVSLYATLPVGTGSAQPQGLAFDSSGNLYSSDYGTRSIVKISNNGATVATFASFPTGTYSSSLVLGGLAIDKNNNLYVTDQDTTSGALGTIYKVTPGGTISPFANVGANQQPIGLAFDANGILYTANVTSISQVSTSGVVSSFAADSNGPDYLVVVPEPATWLAGALLVVGVGWTLRRRRA